MQYTRSCVLRDVSTQHGAVGHEVQHVVVGFNWSYEGILGVLAVIRVLRNHHTQTEWSVLNLPCSGKKREKTKKFLFLLWVTKKIYK